MTDPIEKLTNHLIERKTVQVAEKPPNDDDHVNLGEELFPIHIDDVPAPEIPVDFRALTQYDAETILTPTIASDDKIDVDTVDNRLDAEFFALDIDAVPSEISMDFRALTQGDVENILGRALTPDDSHTPAEGEDGEAPSKRSVTEYRAARMAEEKHRFLMWLDTLYIWISPAYRKLKENELIAILKDSFDENITEQKTVAFWRGVIAQLESNSNNFIELSEIHHPDEEVVFRNGVYNVRTQKIRPASPDDYFLTFNDIAFDREFALNGKVTEQFFEDFSGGDPEIKDLAWAIIGAILSQGNAFKKYFVFYGTSDTGKSVLGNVIETLVGKANCTHFSMNRLSGFETAQLVGKKLNSNLDLSAVEISDLGVFKMLSGGGLDTIDCQKKYGRFVTLRTNEIKMLFATNALPKVSADEDPTSFFGRMILLPFLNSVPAERKNPHLAECLMDEKDYIIQKAMEAYRRLLDNNFAFPHCEIAEKIVAAHSKADKKSDPLDEFVRFDCILSPEYATNNELLYGAYLKRCCTDRAIPLSKNKFVGELRRRYRLDRGREKRDPAGKRAHTTLGIALCAELDWPEQTDVVDLPK